MDKAKKLADGRLSVEDYIETSKMSLDELIKFAKKQKMGADVIRGLNKRKKEYEMYAKPFKKMEYLRSTIILINGEEVRPTAGDVEQVISYLNANQRLICAKNVADTVRGYLRGENRHKSIISTKRSGIIKTRKRSKENRRNRRINRQERKRNWTIKEKYLLQNLEKQKTKKQKT